MAERHQQGGKHVALLVDHAAHIALCMAAPLQALVEIIDHLRHVFGNGRVLDDEAVGILHPQFDQLAAHLLRAANEDRRAIAEIAVLHGRTQRHVFFRLGKDDPLGVGPDDLVDVGQRRRGRVEPALELVAIGVEILDLDTRHAAIHRRLGDGGGYGFHQPRIERHRDDVILPEGVVGAIGSGHFLRHRHARQLGNGLGRGDLHLLVDRRRPDVEGAAEDEREAEHVVDLVGIIAAPGGDDRIRTHRLGVIGSDLGIGIGHGEDDRLVGHVRHPFGLDRALDRQAEEDVRALQRLFQRPALGVDGMGALPLVDAFAAVVDHAGAVAHGDVLVLDAHRLDQRGTGDGGGAGAVHHDLHVRQLAAGDVAGIDEASRGDDRRAVLVVVHDRDIHPLAQRLLDDEALGRLDVLEIDAAKARLHQGDRLDEGIGVLGRQLEVDRIDIGEALEQHRLAFHHRLGGERAEIAEAEDRRAVGDHRHQVGTGRVSCRGGGIFGDCLDRGGDARRIGERQVALRRHRLGGDDLDLTGTDRLVIEKRFPRSEVIGLVGQCVPPSGPTRHKRLGRCAIGESIDRSLPESPMWPLTPMSYGRLHNPDDGTISCPQGRGRGLPAVLPHGGFLRTLLRGCEAGLWGSRHRPYQPRRAWRRTRADVRRAGPRGGELSRPADPCRLPGGDRRTGRDAG